VRCGAGTAIRASGRDAGGGIDRGGLSAGGAAATGWFPGRLVGAYQAASEAVREQRKTLTLVEATELVTNTFAMRGVPAPSPEDTRALARVSLDRFRVWKHPVTAYREGWFWSPSRTK
jgi:hypothetical protein